MRYLTFILAIGLAIGAGTFAQTRSAQADWGDDGLGTASLINLVNSNQAAIALEKCADGKIATWHKTNLTFRVQGLLGLNLLLQPVRQGVIEWNNVQTKYKLAEAKANATPDITIQVVPLVGPTKLGSTNVICARGTTGIQSVTIILGVTNLLPNQQRNVTAHEIGHALGLGHSAVPGNRADLMNGDYALIRGTLGVICPSNLDTRALSATATPFSFAASGWSAPKTC